MFSNKPVFYKEICAFLLFALVFPLFTHAQTYNTGQEPAIPDGSSSFTCVWVSLEEIDCPSGGTKFLSITSPRLAALSQGWANAGSNGYVNEQLVEQFEQKTNPQWGSIIAYDPEDPLTGTYTYTDRNGGRPVKITISDPEDVASAPVKLITKGKITGQLIPDDSVNENNAVQMKDRTIELWSKTSGKISTGNKKVYEEGGKYYFQSFDIPTMNSGKGIYEDDYTIKFKYSEHADCVSKEMKGGGADQISCTATLTGEITFHLSYVKGGYAKVTISDKNDTTEAKSPIGGKQLPDTDEKYTGFRITVSQETDSPLDKAISNAIKWVMSGVETTLGFVMKQINALLLGTADLVVGKVGADIGNAKEVTMRGPWISVRNVALSLLVMALVIIAFANVLQINLEQYGVTRMIPRIIISIVMAYASWIIVVFFFDFTAAIQAQAVGLAGGIDILGTLSSFSISAPSTGDIIANLGILIMVIVILLGVIACGIVLLFTLLIRMVMLSFLLVVAPLAFILNIMPFTANMYKQWWSEFFKWMFMGPIAMAIIALGGLIASSAGYEGASDLTSSAALADFSSSGRTGALVGLIIFAAALYMAATLPMQWGGSIMKSWSGAGKKLWGATGGNALKGAGWAATRVGGKYSVNRMLGKGKGFFENRRANQAAEDKAHLLGFQDKLANSNIPGSTWATTGVAGNRGQMAANNLHVATVAAHHAAAGMGDESTSKEKLMSFTGKQHDQYTREAAATELMRRGLLDMDANELKRFGGNTVLDKDGNEQGAQGLFDEFIGKSDAMKNLGIKSHKELIFGSQNDSVTADFRRKAAKKMIDGDLSASTGAEIGGLLNYAKPITKELRGQVDAQNDQIKNGGLDTRSIAGGDQDVLMAGLANEFTSNISPLQASELIKKKGAPRMTKLYKAATDPEIGATNFRPDTVAEIKDIMEGKKRQK